MSKARLGGVLGKTTAPLYVNVQPIKNVMRIKEEILVAATAMWSCDRCGGRYASHCNGLPLVQNNFTLGAMDLLH